MSATPLQQALVWWASQDDMGGFKTIAAILFPGWGPKRSCKAPHRPDKTESFSNYQNEKGEWCFKDHSTGEQGGLVGFVMLAGIDQGQASRWLMDGAGIRPGQSIEFTPKPIPTKTPESVVKLPAMPVEARSKWNKGIEHLESRPDLIAELAKFRGWPVEFAQYLVDCGTVSMPLYHGQRTIAFLVEVPEMSDGRLTMRDAGFHCRLKPKGAGEKASWRFVPNESEHQQSTPSLPFIIGGSWFNKARLLIFTEGQWDAVTLPLAASWLGEGSKWPEGVCVVGIRGASGTNTFMKHYSPFWPKDANCLLLPDNDVSGSKWFEGAEPFADRLSQLCKKVAVVKCEGFKDFNDLYRAQQITPDQIGALLASHGMEVTK